MQLLTNNNRHIMFRSCSLKITVYLFIFTENSYGAINILNVGRLIFKYKNALNYLINQWKIPLNENIF
jgi:hypothetical protein